MARTLTLLVFVLAALPVTAIAKNEACAGVSKKCTTDKTYDKTIKGKKYSCYDCTQAMCKDGGDSISGTATSSVCTEKASTFQPISTNDQFRGSDTMAPTRTAPKRPRSGVDPRRKVDAAQGNAPIGNAHPMKFDEADALFGKRTSLQSNSSAPVPSNTIVLPGDLFPIPRKDKQVDRSTRPLPSHTHRRDHRDGSVTHTRDHRKPTGRPNTIVRATRGRPGGQSLQAPSDLAIPRISRTTLTLAWHDNSTQEYGVELYRAYPDEVRRDPENAWEFIGLFQARIESRVTGTGIRMDEDYGLSPNTAYCYRMRAYIGFDRAQVSGFSDVTCGTTSL